MKRNVVSLCFSCLLPVVFGGCATTGAHQTVWEYKLVQLSDAEAGLDALGKQGWELVVVTDSLWYYLKRPVKQ